MAERSDQDVIQKTILGPTSDKANHARCKMRYANEK
jgi:hypothetical protein